MRYCTVILILLISLMAIPASAMDAILGTVVSLDRESGKMVVSSEDGDGALKPITVSFLPDRLPCCVRVGGLVRLWGEFMGNGQQAFNASYIRGGGRMHGHDPTGVRSRLGRGGRMGGRGHHGGRGGRGK